MDEATYIINEVLQHRFENMTHCPFFSLTDGKCMLKSRLFKPTNVYPGNSKGGKGTRVQVIYKFHGSEHCDFLFSNNTSYFDCVYIQDYKPNLCIIEKDLKEALNIITKQIYNNYGTAPKWIATKEIFKVIRQIKSSTTKEMFKEFERWLSLHYQTFSNNGENFLKLTQMEKSGEKIGQ